MSTDNHILIQAGKIVTPEGSFTGDVEIKGETIIAVGVDLPVRESCTYLDARGCIVLPGLIDPHSHILLDTGIYQTDDDWEIGTRAAVCGGITTVIDYATQFKGQTFRQAVENRWAEASDKACIDYALHVMVTDLPEGEEGKLAELRELGTPSAKLYTTYRPNYYADDATLLRILRASTEAGVLVTVHCENDALVTAATARLVASGQTSWRYHAQGRPALAEQEAIQRVLFLAESACAPVYIVHCSTGRSVELARQARARGQLAIAETCPQYLLLDDECYRGPQPERYILQPPLRAPAEKDALWQLIAEGAVSTIGTDHCDYTLTKKTAVDDFTRTPGGLPGLETMLPLLYTYGVLEGKLTWEQLSRLCSANPARIFGLYPRKGNLMPGADADLVIFDPLLRQGSGQSGESFVQADKLHTVSGHSPYQGWRISGRVKLTLSRGQVGYREGEFTGKPGHGRFVEAGDWGYDALRGLSNPRSGPMF